MKRIGIVVRLLVPLFLGICDLAGAGQIVLRVPSEAKVYINGDLTEQTGERRTYTFSDEKLDPKSSYYYEFRVVLPDERVITRKIKILPGGTVEADFQPQATTAPIFTGSVPEYIDALFEKGIRPRLEQLLVQNGEWTCLEYQSGSEKVGHNPFNGVDDFDVRTHTKIKDVSLREGAGGLVDFFYLGGRKRSFSTAAGAGDYLVDSAAGAYLTLLPSGNLVAKTDGFRYLCAPIFDYVIEEERNADPDGDGTALQWEALKTRFESAPSPRLALVRTRHKWHCETRANYGWAQWNPIPAWLSEVTFEIIPLEDMFVTASGLDSGQSSETFLNNYWGPDKGKSSAEYFDYASLAFGSKTGLSSSTSIYRGGTFPKESSARVSLRSDLQTGGILVKYEGTGGEIGRSDTNGWFEGYAICPGKGKR